MTTHLFLSPHLDDAVLSSGGLIGAYVERGMNVVVATFCTADPPADSRLSPLAREVHEKWHDLPTPYDSRRREDFAACSVLGAHPLHLNLPDAIYRRGRSNERYASFDALFGAIPSWDAAFGDEVLAALRPIDADLAPVAIYAPLAAGSNVDHQHVLRAALAMHADGRDVWLYEDQPYSAGIYAVQTQAPVASAIASCGQPLHPETHAIDFGRKWEAICRYESQVEELFGADAAGRERFAEYAIAIALADSQGQHAERLWRVASRA